VIRSAVYTAIQRGFAIANLYPGFNLKNLALEEGKKRRALQYQLDGGERMRTRGEGGLEKIGHIWYFTFCNLNGKQVRRSSKSHL